MIFLNEHIHVQLAKGRKLQEVWNVTQSCDYFLSTKQVHLQFGFVSCIRGPYSESTTNNSHMS